MRNNLIASILNGFFIYPLQLKVQAREQPIGESDTASPSSNHGDELNMSSYYKPPVSYLQYISCK